MTENSETVEVKGNNTQVGAKLLAFNNEGKILILMRNPEVYPEAKQVWDIPGGRWQPGTEYVPETLQRELQKETGLIIIDKPEFITKQKFPHGRDKNTTVVRLTYKAKVAGDIDLSEEHTQFKWVSLQELHSLENLDPYVKKLLEEGNIK